jgi:ribosomal protein S18 acetylase RimI-like enzyme
MQVQFTDIKQKDYPELAEMIFSLYWEDDDGEEMDSTKIEDTFFALTNDPEKGRILMIKTDNSIIGYAILVFCWNIEYGGKILIIDDLYIKPQWRNKGLASQFFYYLTKEYKSKVVALKLEVSPSNSDAQRLYIRNGFTTAHNIHMMKMIGSD